MSVVSFDVIVKFLHTADWHLGRQLYGEDLLGDQADWLASLLRLARDENVDAILIAGDVFDRAVPFAGAVMLLDDVLTEIATDKIASVVMISGNHDSAERLRFGSRIFAEQKIHVVSDGHTDRQMPSATSVRIRGRYGEMDVLAIPYADTARARARLDDTTVVDHRTALEALARLNIRAHESLRGRHPFVVMAHGVVSNPSASESERALMPPGLAGADPAAFDGATYVALGHLHQPQDVTGSIAYSGSPMKYSFGERGYVNGVVIGEIDARGQLTTKRVSLGARELVTLTGTFAELLAAHHTSNAYVRAHLSDSAQVFDAFRRLREIYPHLLTIESLSPASAAPSQRPPALLVGTTDRLAEPDYSPRALDPLELFKRFASDSGAPLSADDEMVLSRVMQDVRDTREAE